MDNPARDRLAEVIATENPGMDEATARGQADAALAACAALCGLHDQGQQLR